MSGCNRYQLPWCNKGRFQVKMTINKSRAKIFTLKIMFFLSLIVTDSYDHPVCNSHIPRQDLSCEYINDLCVLQYQVCLLFSSSNL